MAFGFAAGAFLLVRGRVKFGLQNHFQTQTTIPAMAKNKLRTKHFIIGFSRKVLIQRVKLQPGQPLREDLIMFALQEQIDEVIRDFESPRMGSNEMLSLSVSSYPLGDDIQYLATILFREPGA